MKTLIKNIKQIFGVSTNRNTNLKCGNDMSMVEIIENGWILIENDVIPSRANEIILLKSYFVFPSNLASLTYSTEVWLKPAQEIKPLLNLFFSFIDKYAFNALLETNLKSPTSTGKFSLVNLEIIL